MIGIDPTTLPVLAPDPAPPTEPFVDSVPDKEARFLAAAPPEWHEDDWWTGWSWEHHGHRAPVDLLRRAFSFDELTRIWSGQVIQSRLSDWFEERYPLLEKVRHTLWHFRCIHGTYSHIATGVAGLRQLSWPGGDVRLAYCSKWRDDGPAESLPADARIWIDSDLAALVYVGGKHVLTVGFGLGAGAVYVAQVQLRLKRGNRWLYKLGAHYLDVTLDVLTEAFPEHAMWMIEGKSATDGVRRAYGKQPCTMTPEIEARIVALYERPLVAFDRSEETFGAGGRTYRRLLRRAS